MRDLLTVGPGNFGQLFRSLVGEVDFKWQEQFGGVAHIKGPLGVRESSGVYDAVFTSFNYSKMPYGFATPALCNLYTAAVTASPNLPSALRSVRSRQIMD